MSRNVKSPPCKVYHKKNFSNIPKIIVFNFFYTILSDSGSFTKDCINFDIGILFWGHLALTLFRMGVGQKTPSPHQFFPVTSTNVGSSPQTFLTLRFNPFANRS